MEVGGSTYQNDPNIESQWAIRSIEHAKAHLNLVCSVRDPSTLRLTKMDDAIYDEFCSHFPELDVDLICEAKLKSEESKKVWREFCGKFSSQLEDYNFATLFRLDASKGYSEQNTCIVPRVQFLAIEIARNRRGFNKPEILRKFECL
ncbi:unnamed protein product [Dicrocoelium dendriticum]|nr:unnamed protein product [Dicrocoelium dendriticum]